MPDKKTPLEQLKAFLNELFQFDSQDLDFGVYKILHYKRQEIAKFIDELLVNKVQEQLQSLSDDDVKLAKEQLAELEQEDIVKGWIDGDEAERKTFEKVGKDKIEQYKKLKAQAESAKVSVETENQIYNHLTLFFSRYYDKGDFVSKRRFGKNEKYVVPYNGEETHFYWANHDQYYIKSSETFSHYAFKVQTSEGNLIVNFKLHDAQLEQGNVKAEEANFFLLADKTPKLKEKDDSELSFVLANKQPEITEHEITIYFEYRPLGDEEKKEVRGNNKQDTLDEIAFEYLKGQFAKNPLFANLWKEEGDKPLLLKKLQHYTRKNKYDFFIHKNLKGFLERELDYYIKSELVNVENLYVSDSEEHFERIRHNLKTIKVFKTIADTIIDFVSQIEDFQKKLWEKKKFVLSTEWVITIDRLVAYIGEEDAKPILEEVIKNKKQVTEWKSLYGAENIPKKLTLETLKADIHTWKKFAIDTVYFDIGFKYNLLNALSDKIDLEKEADGLVINSDNYHGIEALKPKYSNSLNCIYIDPPYNTNATPIIYKNAFKDSSWLSLIENRVNNAVDLLKSQNGCFSVAIDDNELFNLGKLLQNQFSQFDIHQAIVNHYPGSGTGRSNVSRTHEYNLFLIPNGADILRGSTKDDGVRTRGFRRAGTGSNNYRTGRENSFYAVLVDPISFEIIGVEKPPALEDDDYPTGNTADGFKRVYPIGEDGAERVWSLSYEGALDALEKKELICSDKFVVKRLFYDEAKRALVQSVWLNKKFNATTYGTNLLTDIYGKSGLFSYPKSVYTVTTAIDTITHASGNNQILDFFPGSGTTFHATFLLKKQYPTKHFKCSLIEQGTYTYTLIIPRIKKIAYSFDWKAGKPKDSSMNGLGVFFKYQKLEQYEEALENIAFNIPDETKQQALAFEHYIPKYFLEFETKDSQTLVNTEAMQDPWNYQLKVWDGFTYDNEQAVDLVETFNYLIGLHLEKLFTTEINNKKYQFVYGHNNAGKQILIVWRSVKDWTAEDFKADSKALKEELKNYTYDQLYINGQAHIEGYQQTEDVFKNKMLP